MNEIKKLYELAGVEKPQINYCTSDNCPFNWKYGICQTKKCPNWVTKQSECYPPFTAEKQLELIKQICPSYPLNYHLKCFQGYTFEDGLAKCVNNIWQCVTETEQEEIRKILKG